MEFKLSNKHKNLYTIIDTEDLPAILSHNKNWAAVFNKYGIVMSINCHSKITKRTVILSRVILDYSGYKYIDHIDGNVLNNSKTNLRLATLNQNQANKNKYKNASSDYYGVSFSKAKGKWAATTGKNGFCFHGGYFDNEEDAALASNKLRLRYHGEFARLNIIKQKV